MEKSSIKISKNRSTIAEKRLNMQRWNVTGALHKPKGIWLGKNSVKFLHRYYVKEIRFRNNLKCFDHSTNVFKMINIPFPISVIAMAIPGRFSGRACDGSVTVGSEEMKTKILLCIYTNSRSMEKKIKEVVDLCIMKKKSKELWRSVLLKKRS